ncbi:MAG: SulP family inorganic anion transporter [Magnetococcales bacterium]|nr:SulP family inorganic anion transporter [Magnetococcales bacterium]
MLALHKWLPFLTWFPMHRTTLQADAIAGITVALVLIPQSMAYANLAGLPAYYGLYAAFLPGAVAALFGSSRQLATGPVAVVSLLTASALLPLAPPGSDAFVSLAILMSFLIGVIQLTLGLLRLGVVVNFLSHPVILGFTNAAALIIGLSQLSKIFGVKMGRSERFLYDIWGVLQQLHAIHWPSMAFGVVSFAIMWSLKKYRPRLPNVLIAVALSTGVSWLIGFETMGGKVVGQIPQGLPSFAMPHIDWSNLGGLVGTALIISLVGFMEAISIAKAMAARTRDSIDPNQELIGQGLGNLVGALTQSYPTSGSFSRSAVNLDAGAKSGLSSVITSVMVLLTLLFLTPLLYHLPEATLAAVIMMAVVGLINVHAIHHAWQANRHDGVSALATFIASLGFAPHLDKGIFFGAGLAIILFLYRTMNPRVALLGLHTDGTLRDVAFHPELPTDPGIVVLRFDGQLYFANVSYFEEMVLNAVSTKPNARFVLLVGDGINQIDASGEEVVRHLVERIEKNGMVMVFSGLKRQILQVMHATGLFEMVGGENIFATEQAALCSIYDRLGRVGDRPLLCANR